MSRPRHWPGVLRVLVAASVALAGARVSAGAAGERHGGRGQGAEPELAPGREVRVEAPRSGGHFVLYVPSDYTPERRWPVIFCLHGQNGKPTTWPFKPITRGKGFIIAGLEYFDRGTKRMTLPELDRFGEREMESLRRVASYVERRLKVDKSQYICGGFSKGGWMTSLLGEVSSGTWAGLAILGAGRQKLTYPMNNPRALRGKRIYIGCGDQDPNYKPATMSVDFYRKHGAKVTFETYEGLGHSMKMDTAVLPEWLRGTGPLRDAKARLAAARRAERVGRLGRAYTLYRELAAVSDSDESCAAAAEAAKRLERQATQRLAAAEKAVADKRYADASRLLAAVASRFERSALGERADLLIEKLQSDPAIQASLRQGRLDAEAEALETRARQAEQAGDFAKAVRLYERYAADCTGARRYAAVKAHLDELRANKAVRNAIRTTEATRQCRVWLNLADNYIRARRPDKAREYLQKILAAYDGTDWADKARERLAALGD